MSGKKSGTPSGGQPRPQGNPNGPQQRGYAPAASTEQATNVQFVVGDQGTQVQPNTSGNGSGGD